MPLPTIYSIFPSGDGVGTGSLLLVDPINPTEIHTSSANSNFVDHVEVRVTNVDSVARVLNLSVGAMDFDIPVPPGEGLLFVGEFDVTNEGAITALASVDNALYISALVRREDQSEVLV